MRIIPPPPKGLIQQVFYLIRYAPVLTTLGTITGALIGGGIATIVHHLLR